MSSPYDPYRQTVPGTPPNYNPYQAPVPPAPPQRSPIRMIVLAVIALVIILAAVGGFLIYNKNQVAQQNATATATAQMQATATVLAQQKATAVAVTNANATATAIATSHYPPFTTGALNDPLTSASSGWDSNSTCQFSSTGYQVSVQQAHATQFCTNSGQRGEMAYQVTMSIAQGDCGGLTFRYIDIKNLFFFKVCANGQYTLGDYVNDKESDLGFHANSAIKQGLNQQNVIAITVQGDTVNMYVNGKNIDTATDPILTGSFSQGQIGLLADDTGDPTAVSYTNALVWT